MFQWDINIQKRILSKVHVAEKYWTFKRSDDDFFFVLLTWIKLNDFFLSRVRVSLFCAHVLEKNMNDENIIV